MYIYLVIVVLCSFAFQLVLTLKMPSVYGPAFMVRPIDWDSRIRVVCIWYKYPHANMLITRDVCVYVCLCVRACLCVVVSSHLTTTTTSTRPMLNRKWTGLCTGLHHFLANYWRAVYPQCVCDFAVVIIAYTFHLGLMMIKCYHTQYAICIFHTRIYYHHSTRVGK